MLLWAIVATNLLNRHATEELLDLAEMGMFEISITNEQKDEDRNVAGWVRFEVGWNILNEFVVPFLNAMD